MRSEQSIDFTRLCKTISTRLQLDKVIKEGRAAGDLLREIGEPLPPPIKIKTGFFKADYHGFDDMLDSIRKISQTSIYHQEIKNEQEEQQQKQQQKAQQEGNLEEDREKQKQAYERYLSKYGYVKDAEYDHVSDSVGWELSSTYTRLQAQAWAETICKSMQGVQRKNTSRSATE